MAKPVRTWHIAGDAGRDKGFGGGEGVRTDLWLTDFANHISDRSDIVVETLEKNGGVVYAKSNTPEFGAGGNTFNEVLGTTLNPWNLERSVAGSSGGSAAAGIRDSMAGARFGYWWFAS